MYKLKLFEIITTILKNNLKNANLTDKQIHKMAETIASDLQKRINVRAKIMSKKLVLSDNDVEIISKVLGTAPIIKEFVTLFVISGSHKPCICNSLLNEENVHILKSDSGSKAFLFFTNSELTDNQFDVFNKNHPDYSIKRCGERTIEICLMGDSVATLAASAGLVPFLCKVPKNTEEEIYCGSERVQSKTQIKKFLVTQRDMLMKNGRVDSFPSDVEEIQTEKPIFIPLTNGPTDYYELYNFILKMKPSKNQVMTLETVHMLIRVTKIGPRRLSTKTLFDLVERRYGDTYKIIKRTIEKHVDIVEKYIDYLIANHTEYMNDFSEPDEGGV